MLADGLLRVLVPIYQPNTIYQPDDFAELAVILVNTDISRLPGESRVAIHVQPASAAAVSIRRANWT